MLEVLKYLEYVEDKRQQGKIKHKASDRIAITLFATLANANEWTEIQMFAEANEEFLRQCDYYKTVEKAHGGIEKREYWQTDDISWLEQNKTMTSDQATFN